MTPEEQKTDSPRNRRRWVRLGLIVGIPLVLVLSGLLYATWMPGSSHTGPLPELTEGQEALAEALRSHLVVLSEEIGARHTGRPEALEEARTYIRQALADQGYNVSEQTYAIGTTEVANLEVEIAGSSKAEEIVIVGAHYDSVPRCPAANDNGSGTAALLELARRFREASPERTLRFVAFVNEEPPHFQTERMGSLVYARRCAKRAEKVVAMLSLETMGYFSDVEGSQDYPPPLGQLYPSKGNFIAFVGNPASGDLLMQCITRFRKEARFPSEGARLPDVVAGVGWSDHWSFWQVGYPAVMITDTAPFRYPHYHTVEDTIDKLDLPRMARVVDGLEPVIAELVGSD